MAMDKSSMANKIIANIEARNPNLDASNKALLVPYIEDICDGIIEEIKASMEVITTVNVPGITSGPNIATGTGQQTSIL